MLKTMDFLNLIRISKKHVMFNEIPHAVFSAYPKFIFM